MHIIRFCIISLYPFIVEDSDSRLKKNARPRLHELDMVECGGRSLHVISSVKHRWEKLAIHLHFDSGRITSIGWNSRNNSHEACMSVFSQWLGDVGGSRQPVTWATIVEVCKEIGFGKLSEDLESILD